MTKHSTGTARWLWRAMLVLCVGVSLTACHKSSSSQSDTLTKGSVRIHYYRPAADYAGWGVRAFVSSTTPADGGPVDPPLDWPQTRYKFTKTDAFGAYTDIPVTPGTTSLHFLLNDPNGNKDGGDRQTPPGALASLATTGSEVWLKLEDPTVYASEPSKLDGIILGTAKAALVGYDETAGAIFSWPRLQTPGKTFKLYAAPAGGLTADNATGITSPATSYTAYDATTAASLPADVAAKWKAWADGTVLTVHMDLATLKTVLKGQLVLVGMSGTKPADGTQVQTAPVLDQLYSAAKDADLGVTFAPAAPTLRTSRVVAYGGIPTFRLWAPTAQAVKVNVYADANPATTATAYAMQRDDATGVWSYQGTADMYGKYYTYDVTVFTRSVQDSTGAVVTNTVTDPYSISLSQNSARSLIVDLNDPATKPTGWGSQTLLPTSAVGNESAIYELHIRDFSVADASVPAAHVGKYLAFADAGTKGRQHLEALAAAGLTHVHLLPAFDIATIDEKNCQVPAIPETTGSGHAAADAEATTHGTDCFNWGYDPLHYGAPEGSYASDNGVDGVVRVREFRAMVQALHSIGLRVVMDVVYNHTNASGQADKSVLDKIVPGYYNRFDRSGTVYTSTCCSDTAAEMVMFEKLMTDTLVRWADQYKVDGFRHDLMGFIPKDAILRSKAALDAVAQDDGRGHIYVYGEGWNFGEVQNNALFTQASQIEMAGSNVGTFNDRIRDAVRGGGPFDGAAGLVGNQGFVNGQCYDPNTGTACTDTQVADALHRIDWIEVGLAGNLKDFELRAGVTGGQVDYNGAPAGYASEPGDTINYAGAHDNQTLFDVSQYKHPAATSSADRARAQVMALSIVSLSQGVAFIHAGDDLLRSKSMDSDSYDSGDYFNRIFWDGSRNNWAVGVPPAEKNAGNYDTMSPILDDAGRAVTPADTVAASAAVQDFLTIRKDTSMFHLPNAAQIKQCVTFPDQVIGRQPGVIVMQIGGNSADCGDNKYDGIVVVFNATTAQKDVVLPSWVNAQNVVLHPQQLSLGHDAVVKSATFDPTAGKFRVPARTTAVFVQVRTGTAVKIAPISARVSAGGTQTFTATVLGNANTAVTWSVQEGAAGGTITSGGVYTAPTTPGVFHVVATSVGDSGKSAVSTVTVPGIDLATGAIDPTFGDPYEAGAGSGNVAVVKNVWLYSGQDKLYVAVKLDPWPSGAGKNVFLLVDDVQQSTGSVDLQGDLTLGWGTYLMNNTAAANIDFAMAGWTDAAGLFHAGPAKSIATGGGGDAANVLTGGGDNSNGVIKYAIPYAAIGGGAAAGHKVHVYVWYGKDNGPGGIHSCAPTQPAAQVTLMDGATTKGLADLATAAPDYTLR